MQDSVGLGVALAVCVLPGLAALVALGVRRPVLLAALAAPVSVAVAGLVGTATGAVGLPYGAGTLAAATASLALVAGIRAVRAPRRARPAARRRPLATHAAVVVGVGLTALGVLVGLLTWMRGLGGLATVPQEHDTIVHTLLVAYIRRTAQGAPWELLPIDVVTGEPVYFYPSGLHLLAAATGDLAGGTVVGLNAVTVVLLAVVLSVSAASLAVVAARRLHLGAGSAALAGGVASLVAAGLYRPTFQFAHDGGVLANGAALAMAPAVVAAVLLLPGASRATAAAVGVGCVGIVWVHPSAAVSVAVTVLAWWLAEAATRSGRRLLRSLPVPLGIAGVTAAVLLLPVLLPSSAAAARTSTFPADTPAAGVSNAIGATLGLAYGGYLDPERLRGQLWAAALVALGIVAVLMLRRGLGPVAAWGAWAGITVAYFLSPDAGPETVVTAFLYKGMVRVWSHVSLLVPVLAGLGIVLVAARLAVLTRRRVPLHAGWLACAVVVLVAAGYAAGPARSYAATNAAAVASRYADPDFVRVDSDDLRAAAWLAARVRPGERVMNSANDGSTILYVEHGVPIVNVYPLGLPQAPYTYELLQSFNRYPDDPGVRRMLTRLDVAWVYVDARAPSIGAAGSPEGWAGDALFRFAPGLLALDGLPGLRPEFRSGAVSIYSLDLDDLPAPDAAR